MPENSNPPSPPKARPALAPVDDSEQDTSGFVGVSPEYQNYASDVHKPLTSDDKDEKRLVEESRKNAEENATVQGSPRSQSSPGNHADARRTK